jgi:hypothetical protein
MVLQLANPLPRVIVELLEEEETLSFRFVESERGAFHDPPHVAST